MRICAEKRGMPVLTELFNRSETLYTTSRMTDADLQWKQLVRSVKCYYFGEGDAAVLFIFQ
jgi:hypothetical protein